MSLNNQSLFLSTLCGSSSILAARMCVIHLLTARTRVMSGLGAHTHDAKNALNPVLKIALCCYGTDFGGMEFVQRCERIAKNCTENEPFFLILAASCYLSGVVPEELGAKIVSTFTIARIAHTGVFLMGDKVNAAFRAIPYVVGLVCTMTMSALGLGLKL